MFFITSRILCPLFIKTIHFPSDDGTKSIIFSLTQTLLFDKRARPDYKAGARPGKRRGVLTLLI
jgi:hypothetical protein